MPPVATVVVPTHDHGATLQYAVASALAQTVADLEVIIVGDGMPAAAAEIARRVAAEDRRVTLLDLPKGPRHGELHRHAALGRARGRHVFYLSDDDLWLPEHVQVLSDLLDETGANFACSRQAARLGDGTWALATVDLASEFHRQAMRDGFNRVGLSEAAHTLAGYRRLPHGWRTTPHGTPTDLFMWQQWLAQPWARFATAPLPTALHFPSHERRGAPPEQRLRELRDHLTVLQETAGRQAWLERLIGDGFARAAWLETHWQEQAAWLANREEALAWHVRKLAELARVTDDAT